MFYCTKCNKLMVHVMRFENGKASEFYRCPICWAESKKMPLFFNDDKLKQEKKRTNNTQKKTNKPNNTNKLNTKPKGNRRKRNKKCTVHT